MNIHIPVLVIQTALFALLFPLAMRMTNRKWIGWKAALIGAAVYALITLIFEYTALPHILPHMLRF